MMNDQLDEIARLLNDGEHSEAAAEMRRMLGLVNRWVCQTCGHRSDSTRGGECPHCGGEMWVMVVAEMPAGCDAVLADMRAADDDSLRLRKTVGGTGLRMWAAEYRGHRASGVSPADAMADLAGKLQNSALGSTRAIAALGEG